MKRGPIPERPLRWRKKPLVRVPVHVPPTREELDYVNELEHQEHCVEMVPFPEGSQVRPLQSAKDQ